MRRTCSPRCWWKLERQLPEESTIQEKVKGNRVCAHPLSCCPSLCLCSTFLTWKPFFLMLFLSSGSAAASLSLDLSSPQLTSILALLGLGPDCPDSTLGNAKARGLLGTAAVRSTAARRTCLPPPPQLLWLLTGGRAGEGILVSCPDSSHCYTPNDEQRKRR